MWISDFSIDSSHKNRYRYNNTVVSYFYILKQKSTICVLLLQLRVFIADQYQITRNLSHRFPVG